MPDFSANYLQNISRIGKTSKPVFQKDNFTDENLEQVQSNSDSSVKALANHPLIKGRLIEGIEFKLSNNYINFVQHKLGRKPKGYIIVRKDSSSTVYDSDVTDKILTLLTDGETTTISIWVF